MQYKIMEKPDYSAITACLGDNPKQRRWRDHPTWGRELLQFHAPDTRLYLGAYQGADLVGCMIAHPDKLQIKGTVFNAAIIAITEVCMANRNQGIATKLLTKLLDQLSQLKFDLVLAFLIADRGGTNILKQAGFKRIHKYGHAGKVFDKEKMDQLMDLNPILRKIALKIVDSSTGNTRPPYGIIREAADKDFDQITALLNAENTRLDISSVWTQDYLKRMMNWRYKIFVFEDKGTILGSIICYEEIATLGKAYFTSGLLKEMVFAEGIDEETKTILMNFALTHFKKKGIPCVTYPYPKNIWDIIKKTGFNVLPGDERSVYIKPLCAAAQQVLDTAEKFRFVNVFLIC
ncbi:MAG: GNAT family N-acetyltransferase [Candidatus Helarchaeota archaeon]|nr:GNAT family N-acetyltransferase [Candidatus Helarchaeota archaeon]